MKRLLTIAASSVLFFGCSHGMMRGTVAMKISDDEAHVCMGDHEVKVGDRVTLLDNKCDVQEKKFRGCKLVKVGEGEIVQTLNEHYSVVKVSPGTPLREGTIVEKK